MTSQTQSKWRRSWPCFRDFETLANRQCARYCTCHQFRHHCNETRDRSSGGWGKIEFTTRQLRLQEIPSGSIYKNSSKNRAKLSLVFWDILSSAIMNDLSMTFTSRLKMDAKCVISSEIGSQWRTIFGHLQLIECMGIRILSLAHVPERRVPTLFAYCEKQIWKIFFKFNQGTCPWMAFAWIFFSRDFSNFFEGDL